MKDFNDARPLAPTSEAISVSEGAAVTAPSYTLQELILVPAFIVCLIVFLGCIRWYQGRTCDTGMTKRRNGT